MNACEFLKVVLMQAVITATVAPFYALGVYRGASLS